MAVFKCKMCGGTLEINNESVATCEYCGTQQTLPRLDDERRADMYDRANHYRRNKEFDKAMGLYEQILNEDKTDAEAYWSLVLCRYGVEYVEDPATHRRIPTVSREQFTSIYDDYNYKAALEYADSRQKVVYEKEANTINEIQKRIIAIVSQEDPYDVFICYKETDDNDERTEDSVLANVIYDELTEAGLRVFFARITLEDKLGANYDSYIFTALNSAKVMIVLGTKAEYFNAVWVKNEWSRYLGLIKQGQKKTLIPAIKYIKPDELPNEFSHLSLQAQDLGKIGGMQDLIRGVKKLAAKDESTVNKSVTSSNDKNPLLERALMFIEDGEWLQANEYCEKVLDMEPQNADAYVKKLLIEKKVKKQTDLRNCSEPFTNNKYYIKALRFADASLKNELEGINEYIILRNKEALYSAAQGAKDRAKTYDEFHRAADMFKKPELDGYKNSKELSEECVKRAHEIYFEGNYQQGMEWFNMQEEKTAKKYFELIPGYKNVGEMIERCNSIIKEKEKEEMYASAVKYQEKDFSEYVKQAIRMFKSIQGYKDADKRAVACEVKYQALLANENAEKERERVRKEAEIARINAQREAEIARIKAQREAEREKREKIAKSERRKSLIKVLIPIILFIAMEVAAVVLLIKHYDEIGPAMDENSLVLILLNGAVIVHAIIARVLSAISEQKWIAIVGAVLSTIVVVICFIEFFALRENIITKFFAIILIGGIEVAVVIASWVAALLGT